MPNERDTILGLGWPQFLFVCVVIYLAANLIESYFDIQGEAIRSGSCSSP